MTYYIHPLPYPTPSSLTSLFPSTLFLFSYPTFPLSLFFLPLLQNRPCVHVLQVDSNVTIWSYHPVTKSLNTNNWTLMPPRHFFRTRAVHEVLESNLDTNVYKLKVAYSKYIFWIGICFIIQFKAWYKIKLFVKFTCWGQIWWGFNSSRLLVDNKL